MFMRHRRVVPVGVCLLFGIAVAATEARAQSLPSPWLTRTIGSPSPSGTATYSSALFSVSGSGADTWGSSDQFRFVYQPMTGDVEIIARVNSFAAADPWSKIGVMIRNDLTAGSAHAFAFLSGAHGMAFQRRLQSGGASYNTSGALVSAPQWVRLRRVGTTLTAWSGADGSTWQTIGSATITLNSTVYVGLAITSHNPGSLASAVVSNVTVTTYGLPTGQATKDIGSPAIAGSATYSGGTYTVKGAGADIWGSADQFRYVYQQVTGDFDVVARVGSLQNTDAWSKAGVMVRETLASNARHAMALISAGKGYSFQWRLDTGGLSANTAGGSGAAPGWVRLKRTGYRFDAFRSTDGISWTSFGVESVPMASTVYVGLAVTSHDSTAATTALIDHFKVTATTATAANQLPTVSLTSPASGSFFGSGSILTLAASASDPEGRLSHVEFYVGSTRVASDTSSPYSTTWSTTTAGSYAIKAIAYDANGGVSTSATHTVTITTITTTSPSKVVFQASADHATLVTSYRLDVFANGAKPGSSTPVATSNLGKPTPDANKTITVDRTTFFSALAHATYIATVSAIGSGGETRSSAITFTR
jgi:regulation of enolase protein 1 (concanavalin A-like superfamily)